MKAVGLYRRLPVDDPECLVDLDLPRPEPAGRDLLVEVRAVSVNPVDTKVRRRPEPVEHPPLVLGWDAAGVVVATGPDCRLFRPGDAVYYAGSITRPGCNAEFHLVDERIVGLRPATLSFEAAAALPLTAITAWEALVDRMRVPMASPDRPSGARVLIIGAAGGVGSIAIQLARHVTGLQVIATASRPESAAWCRELGAHHVVSHAEPLAPQLAARGVREVEYVLCCSHTDEYYEAMAALVAPQGRICCLVDARQPLDLNRLKAKSATLSWEFMFTRPMFQTEDLVQQHHILTHVARLVDEGVVRPTVRHVVQGITAASLRAAHARLEEGRMVGKLVLTGW